MSLSENTFHALLQAAKAAAAQAHAPYSHFPVGAALLDREGHIIRGCNLENASYGLTVCAERNAVASAICQGLRHFSCLLIYTPQSHIVPPCGACRQVLAEFMAPDSLVIAVSATGQQRRWQLQQLLPDSFHSALLQES